MHGDKRNAHCEGKTSPPGLKVAYQQLQMLLGAKSIPCCGNEGE